MLRAGTIRRVRQTLMATNLAPGALVAWQFPTDKLDAAFDYMFQDDPFSGHVVIRSTDAATPGSNYRLWTTLKVPQGYSMEKHCELLARMTGAEQFRVMPAKRLFALGVGHVRRKGMEPGSKSDELAEVIDTKIVELTDARVARADGAQARVRSRTRSRRDLWRAARRRGGRVARDSSTTSRESLNERERHRPLLHLPRARQAVADRRARDAVQRAVPLGRAAGPRDRGGPRGRPLPHPDARYWREGGPEFRNVNIMAVAHGTEKDARARAQGARSTRTSKRSASR